MRASVLLVVFKNVIPTQRGDRVFKMSFPELNCGDAAVSACFQECVSNRAQGSYLQSELSRGELLRRHCFCLF